MNPANEVIQPQVGPQMKFLSSPADIAFYGGAAGGGKSFGLLLEPVRHILRSPKFGGVVFRRSSVQVRNEGGLWDESVNIYGRIKAAIARESYLEWEFQNGSRMKFSHLEHDKNIYDWQGSQIPYIGFDELTHFTKKQFWYMLSRNRSTSGIPGYVRATMNADADSWVRELIDWWIGPDGYPILERSGKIRYFIRRDDGMFWGDTKKELIEKFGKDETPKSFTFIPSLVTDNKILMQKDPSYLSNLRALARVDRMRLLMGNWNVRESAGMFFQRGWFEVVDAIPPGWISICRYWDRAATKPSDKNPDPDFTTGLKMYKYKDGTYVVADMRRVRESPGKVEALVKSTASQDGYLVKIIGEQDPGSAGVADAQNFVRMLAGYNVHVRKVATDKATRAKPVSAQAEVGAIKILRANWNEDFFIELENFPEGGHDDQVDVLSGAFNEMCGNASILDSM